MTEWTHSFTLPFPYPAPPARAFAAFSDPDLLKRWFAEHAEIEARQGGAYRFWGKSSYGTLRRGDAMQRIIAYEPGARLSFTWPLHGVTSEVTLSFAAKGEDGSDVTMSQRFPSEPDTPRFRHAIEDLWRMHAGNLYMFLKDGAPALTPDFTDPSPEVKLSVFIKAPRERVFDALLKPETMNKWISSAAEVEPRVGGKYVFGWNYQVEGRDVLGGPTRIIELVPGEKLVTDWGDWRGDPSIPAQTITWELSPEGDGTRVTMTHAGFVRTVDVSDYAFGWGDFLSKLKAAAETG